MIILPSGLAFQDRSANLPAHPARGTSFGVEGVPAVASNPHGPFGFWKGGSRCEPACARNVWPGKLDAGNFPWNQPQPVPGFLFFCFVDFWLSLHTFCSFKLDGFCMWLLLLLFVPCWLWHRLRIDSIPTRSDGRLWDFPPSVLRVAPRKIARRKAERYRLKRKNLFQNNEFPLLLIVSRFSRDVIELYLAKHSK